MTDWDIPSVIFYDSGVGGLPYLECARSLLPSMVLHYFADAEGFPYGTKTPAQIEDLLLERTRRLRARLLPSVLVIACNTASQVGLSLLRRANPDLTIVGTVPAIKPAAASTRTGKIAVLATERAVADPYLDDLIARHAPDAQVTKKAAQDLVTFVERSYLGSTPEERRRAVEPYVTELLDAGVDRIVLACTHFLHLEPDFSSCCASLGAEEVQIIDSRQGVANRLAQIVEEQGLGRPGGPAANPGRFLLTGRPPFDRIYRLWAERFDLSPPEML